MKISLIPLSLLLAAGAALAADSEPEFEQVLEIKRTIPDAKEDRMQIKPVFAASEPSKPSAGARERDPQTAGLPLIGGTPASNPAASPSAPVEIKPLAAYATMSQAAQAGVDPLSMRSQTAVLKKEVLSKVDERSIWEMVKDEWRLVRNMTQQEQVQWAKGNPAVVLGLLGTGLVSLLVLFALLRKGFRRNG